MRFFLCLPVFLLCLAACKHDMPSQTQAPATDAPAADTIARPNPWKDDPCALVTEEEVAQIFGLDPKKDVLSTKSKPALCLRTWMRPNWKVIESENTKPGAEYREFRNILVLHIIDYGTPVIAKEQLAQLRRDRRATFEEDVPGLGDDAIWSSSTTSLYVRRGQLVLNLSLTHLDTPHDNLPKAKEVAAVAMRKM